jgi:hypothetical protein
MAGFLTSTKTQQHRLSICEKCKHYRAKTRSCGPLIRGGEVTPESVIKELVVSWKRSKYKLCGCFMPVKVTLKLAECPLGYWRADIALTKSEREEALEWARLVRMKSYLTEAENKRLHQLASDLSGVTHEVTTCAPCVSDVLARVYETLKDE